MEVTPAAFLLAPLLLVAATRRKVALYLFFASVPFFKLEIITAVGHVFNLPELVMIVIIAQQVVRWVRSNTLRLPDGPTIVALLSFLLVGIFAGVYLLFDSPVVLVRPYNLGGGFGDLLFVPVSASRNNITQSLLRMFSVLAIIALSTSLSYRDVRIGIRILIVGALATGAVGVLYQAAILLEVTGLLTALQALGFSSFPLAPNTLGPIPRMWSFPSEPGRTADLLLYALGLSVTLALSERDNDVVRFESSVVASLCLLAFLTLSTGTTGYGGFLILCCVLGISTLLFRGVSVERYVIWVSALVAAGLSVGLLLVLTGFDIVSIVSYQIEKLSFSAGSGSTRLQYILLSIDAVKARPLVGLGFGSHRAPSLLFTLLAEVGFVGLCCYLVAHIATFRECLSINHNSSRPQTVAAALFVGGVTVLLTNLVAKSVATLIYPWYWCSLALPLALVLNYRRGKIED